MTDITWGEIYLDKIRSLITSHGFDVGSLDVPTATREELTEWLENHNLTPGQFFGTHTHHHQVTSVTRQSTPKVEIRQAAGEDLLDYLKRFECAVLLNQIPEDKQVPLLHLNLDPKYSKFIAEFDAQTQQSYDQVKRALLQICQVTKFHYLQKFQSLQKQKDESFLVFANKLKGYYREYAQVENPDQRDVQSLLNAVVLPRLLEQLPKDLLGPMKSFALSHTFEEILQELENQVSARSAYVQFSGPRPFSRPASQTQNPQAQNSQAQQRPRGPDQSRAPPRRQGDFGSWQTSDRRARPQPGDGTCFRCHRRGHIARDCTTPLPQGNGLAE